MSRAGWSATADAPPRFVFDPPTVPRPRLEFQEPGPDGFVYGYLFRIVAALLAVLVSVVVLLIFGAASEWRLSGWMLACQAVIVVCLVAVSEHMRSRVYERLALPGSEPTADPSVVGATDRLSSVRRVGASIVLRIVDLVLGVVSLILFGPLMLLIVVLIKLDSAGPALFVVRRLGKGGRTVHLLRFRTMRMADGSLDAEWYQSRFAAEGRRFPLESDPRMSRAGRFLRMYALDYLPTLLNVIRGDVSLVGPRALEPREAATLPRDILAAYQSLTPGLVSWSTVYVTGATRRPFDWKQLVLADIAYHSSASLPQQLRLLFVSTTRLLSRAGAV